MTLPAEVLVQMSLVSILFMYYVVRSTIKQGCTAGIKLKLSDDGQTLTVTSVSVDHNHVIDKVFTL